MKVTEFAKLLGISQQTASKGIGAGRVPEALLRRDRRGRVVEIVESEQAKLAWQASATVTHPGTAASCEAIQRWREARARREEAAASLAELDLRTRQRELVEIRPLLANLATFHTGIRNKLLGVHARFGQEHSDLPRGAIMDVDKLIREALEEIAHDDEETFCRAVERLIPGGMP